MGLYGSKINIWVALEAKPSAVLMRNLHGCKIIYRPGVSFNMNS